MVVEFTFEGTDQNKAETAKKVRKFLEYDFQNYLNRAGMHRTDLSSPQLDPTSVSSHGGNSAENKMFRLYDYQAKCLAVYQTIMDCEENENKGIRSKSILKLRYLDDLSDSQVEARLHLSGSRYRYKKNRALCEFADRLHKWATINDTNLPDLSVYK